ncbi:MAG: hypothetical protein IPM57_09865 [Oligoflexia bacterium]|nr:hypothetical protein [Oligoflexia bacterium]
MRLFLLAILLFTQIFVQPSLYANQACADQLLNLAPRQAELPHITEHDVQAAKDRRAFHQKMRALLFGDKYKIDETDSEAVKALKILLQKREYSSFFRFKDETLKNLDKPIADFKALAKPLLNPQLGYLAKLMLIRQAEYTVDLTYYIFAKDEAGRAIVYELMQALKRGVSVRVMVDSVGSLSASATGNQHLKSLITFAKENAGYVKDPITGKPTNIKASVEVLIFNPLTNWISPTRDFIVRNVKRMAELLGMEFKKDFQLTGWNPNRRSHDKIIMSDAEFASRAVVIVGGRNVANRYYELDPSDTANFRDGEVIVRNHPDNFDSKDRYSRVGEVITDQYDRLYFHRANWRLYEGPVGKIFGREKDYKKMAEAFYKVEEATWKTLNKINEDIRKPDFGKKFLTQGFEPHMVNFINSAQNIAKNTPEPLEPLLGGLVNNTQNQLNNKGDLLTSIISSFANEHEAVTIVSPYLWLSDGSKKGTLNEIGMIREWLKGNPRRHLYVYTNSVITSDNIPAQALVDMVTAPKLMLDPELSGRVTVYEYGRINDAALGGTKVYGKLHYKAVYFHGQKLSVITTYNKDPRSQFINSEVGVTIRSFDTLLGSQYSKEIEADIADIREKSHLWGSEEFTAIRTHEKLSLMQKTSIKYQSNILWLLEKLHLWWLI